MMDMHIQAELMEKRGEVAFADMLRGFVADEAVRVKEMELAKRKADNVILIDKDF